MILERLVVGMLQTNCYLLADSGTRRAAVIDPGGDSARIVERIEHHQLNLVSIINTHGHFDHVLDAWALKKKLGGEVFLHPEDKSMLQDRSVGLAALFSSIKNSPKGAVDRWLHEGDTLEVGALRLEVLETPGHTPGHVALYLRDRDIIFVGDTLFAGSIGRTDFPGGSFEQLITSVRTKIFPLDESTVVYPGHGPETTVGEEKRSNPFFK
jgi:hydroxyacylglutathione hydrolase